MLLAFLVSFIAGVSTAIGGLLGLSLRKLSHELLAAVLSFAAGVMLYISFAELLNHAIEGVGFPAAHVYFFSGTALMFIIDILVPHHGEERTKRGSERSRSKEERLQRTAALMTVGVAIHNLPEGMATFAGALGNPRLGLVLAFAIAVHNIPEGLVITAPLLAAGTSKIKAFSLSLLSGLAEPLGALLVALIFGPVLEPDTLAGIMGAVAGVMVYISVDELIPDAREHNDGHIPIWGTVAGMLVIATSLFLLDV